MPKKMPKRIVSSVDGKKKKLKCYYAPDNNEDSKKKKSTKDNMPKKKVLELTPSMKKLQKDINNMNAKAKPKTAPALSKYEQRKARIEAIANRINARAGKEVITGHKVSRAERQKRISNIPADRKAKLVAKGVRMPKMEKKVEKKITIKRNDPKTVKTNEQKAAMKRFKAKVGNKKIKDYTPAERTEYTKLSVRKYRARGGKN